MAYLKKEYADKYIKGRTSDIGVFESISDYKRKAEWIYSLYCAGTLMVKPDGFINNRSIAELRSYANGSQNVGKYKALISSSMKDGSDPGLMPKVEHYNISWDNAMLFSKFRAIAVSKISDPEFDVNVVATDTFSNMERSLVIAKDRLEATSQMSTLAAAAGMPSEITQVAASIGDVDSAISIGAYTTACEALMQDAIGVTFDNNSWRVLNRMFAQDICDIGIMAFDTTMGPDGSIKVKYIDPAGMVFPLSQFPDNRDIPFAGYLENVRLCDLKIEAGIDEEQAYKVAKLYSSYYPNIPMRAGVGSNFNDLQWRQSYQQKNNMQVYDPYTASVFRIVFKAVSYENGMAYQTVHRASWIVGTDIVFGFGIDHAIGRIGSDGNKEAMLPVFIYTVPGPSIVGRAISHIDDMQIAILKIRALISNLPPGLRRSIDLTKLRNSVSIGGRDYSMLDLLAVERNTGTLFFESTTEFDDPMRMNSQAPIQPLPSGIAEDLNIYQNQILTATDMIRQVTGLNEVADGTTQTRDLLIGVMEGMQSISNSAISDQFEALKEAYKNCATLICKRYQAALSSSGGIELTSIRLTASGLHVLKLNKDLSFRTLNVRAIPAPSQGSIDLMKQQVVAKVQDNQISQADMAIVISMLDARNAKAATLYLAKAIQIREDQLRMQQQENLMVQSKSQQELSIVQEDEKRKTIEFEYQQKSVLVQLTTKLEIEKMKEAQRLGVSAKAFEIEAGQMATN